MNKLIKKIFSISCIGALSLSLLSGCSSSDSAASGSSNIKVLYSVCDVDDTFRKNLTEGIIAAGKSAGITLDVSYCGSQVDNQAADIAAAKANGYDAIILRLTDVSTALQMEVTSNDLPIVFVNNQPDDDFLSADKYIYVGSQEEEAGELQVEYAMKKLGNPSSLNVIIFEGEKGHSGTVGRTSAVKNTLKDLNVSANYVFLDYATWSDTLAAEKMNIFLKTGQPYDVIFCNNDTMALGVCQALKDNGIDPASVPVMGVDATSDGCASIAAGEMAFTVLQDAQGQAEKAVEAIIALSSGKSVSSIDGASENKKYIWVPFEAVDSSNVSKYQ
ncbi:MAG: substrate-binding domain-containing protein [Butyrivibrio sp.]|nr:substrate-binding domain-containing protein [Butyrivibrio sp.]